MQTNSAADSGPDLPPGAAGAAGGHQEAAESLQDVWKVNAVSPTSTCQRALFSAVIFCWSQRDAGVPAASCSPVGAAAPLLHGRPAEGEEGPAAGAEPGGAELGHRPC